MKKLFALDNYIARTFLGGILLAVIVVCFMGLVLLYDGLMTTFVYLIRHQRITVYVLIGLVVSYLVGALVDGLSGKDSHILFKASAEAELQ